MYPEELKILCDELRKSNPEIFLTIETNGTYIGDFYNSFNLISVSPKLSSSVPHDTEFEKMHEKNRLNLEALTLIHSLHLQKKCDVQWKFVFSSQEDVKEIKSLQQQINFSDNDVYIMPEGICREDLEMNRMKTVEVAIENNWNYSDRLHIMIWGNKRGV
jgi:organic radical activating enzyme